MKNRLKRNSIYQEMMYAFARVFFLSILIIAVINGIVTTRYEIDKYKNYAGQTLSELERSVRQSINEVENISRYILANENIQELLTINAVDPGYEISESKAEVSIIQYMLYTTCIESIAVYRMDGKYIETGNAESYVTQFKTLQAQSWYEEVLSNKGKHRWINASYITTVKEKNRILLARAINKNNTRTLCGFLVITLKNQYFEELINEINEVITGDICICDMNGSILYGSAVKDASYDKTVIERYLQSNMSQKDDFESFETYYISKNVINEPDWMFLMIDSKGHVIFSGITTIIILILVSIMAGLSAAIIYNKFAKKLERNMKMLILSMEESEKNKFTKEMDLSYFQFSEFIWLGKSFNEMIHRTGILINEVMQQKIRVKQAQLESLQAKVNPHFLYNTLDCINWKALAAGQDEISEMIICLSKMFRFSLGKGEKVVSLSDEIENVRCYLLLQQKRMDEKLVYLIELPEHLASLTIIKFVLQPLVENSVLHGLKNIQEKGYIGVLAEEEESYLSISIIDNGSGIDEEKIALLLNGGFIEENGKLHGQGIYNVNERLKGRYGEESALHFENRKNGGTKVSIRISMEKLQ